MISAVHGFVGAGPGKPSPEVFGPGRNPINVAGPENLTFTAIADRLITASGKPGRIRHVPLPILRAMSVLARRDPRRDR